MRSRELGVGGCSIGAALAALMLPKCPLCVAALLSAMGMGCALAEAVVPLVRPAAFALALVLAASLVARRARRHKCPHCARPSALRSLS